MHRIVHDTVILDGMTVHLGAPDGVAVTFAYVAAQRNAPVVVATASRPAPGPTGDGDLHGEITEVITPPAGRALPVDAALADLPPDADPMFAVRAEPLRHRLAGLARSMANTTAAVGGFDAAEAFGAIAHVYRRLLTPGVGPRARHVC
jgi:hypothetical protein